MAVAAEPGYWMNEVSGEPAILSYLSAAPMSAAHIAVMRAISVSGSTPASGTRTRT